MPNEIRTTKKAPLDNLCLTPVKGISSTLYNTEFLRAMEIIRQKDLEKKRAFHAYLDRYKQDATQAAHLKSLVAFQRRNAPSKTMRTCTTTPIACIRSTAEDLTPITLKVNEYAYSLSGLNRCKNPMCTMCSRSRAGQRSHRIRQGIEGASDKGLEVLFVTLTIPRQETVKGAREEIAKRWAGVSSLFHQWKKAAGVSTYYARALDVTFKKYVPTQRYHLHIHAVVVVSPGVVNPAEQIQNRWLSYNRKGCKARATGQHIESVKLQSSDVGKVSKYVAKMAGLALEIANGTAKKSKGQSSTLSDLMMDDTPLTRSIYRDYLQGMKRARTMVFSRNWDDLIDDAEDEELSEYEVNIPLDKWSIVSPVWMDLGDKLQFELFTQSVNSQGETDHHRRFQVLTDLRRTLQEAKTTACLQWFIYSNYD